MLGCRSSLVVTLARSRTRNEAARRHPRTDGAGNCSDNASLSAGASRSYAEAASV